MAEKYLGLGFMKTGLSSLNAALTEFGIHTVQRDRKIWMAFIRGDLAPVMAHYETAEAFLDWPHPYMYRPFLAKYGDEARFILTLREAEGWYDSLLRHNRYAHPFMHTSKHHFGRYYPHGFRQEHIDIYNRHNDEVQAFFAREGLEDRLLVIETAKPDTLERLRQFVGVEMTLDAYPRKNVSDARKYRGLSDTFRKGYNALAFPAYAALAPKVKPEPGPYFLATEADGTQTKGGG